MSSDEYFDDELDSAFLQQFDIIDAQHRNGTLNTGSTSKPSPKPPPPAAPPLRTTTKVSATAQKTREVITLDDSDEYGEFDIVINEDALRAIDQACDAALAKGKQKPAAPTAGPSRRGPVSRTNSRVTIQTTLDGGVLTQPSPSKKAPNSSRSPLRRRTSSTGNNVFRGKAKKTKQWDHTAFAKSGWKQPKNAKGKEKAFGSFEDEEMYEEEEMEFEQFPAPFVSVGYVFNSDGLHDNLTICNAVM
ncbi:hypothetical protein EIP86_004264 [Pleurotus ostreatoroseus]|nr:hypothetical protein EIP86_004264 [Pleurotus ostreatoroseus]